MKITVNGKAIEVPSGAMVSAAVSRAGVTSFRISTTSEPRGPLCGMGICFECRVTVDGQSHVRSCQTPCREGMDIRAGEAPSEVSTAAPAVKSASFEVVVIGAGPAGLAAARCASECGATVAMIDDNPAPGGQIWRGKQLSVPKVEVLCSSSVVAAPEPGHLSLDALDLAFRRLVLATGARERFLPFPGWTLPHVMGAGGLQALAKSGIPIEGKRIIVAGSGPLLLAVAKYLRDHGAKVPLVAEQAESSAVMRFGLTLARHPAKLLQAAPLRLGIRYLTNCWPVSAQPGKLTLRRGAKTWTEDCDYVACGFGLIPNTELPALLGCQMSATGVAVNTYQQTSVESVYAAGEVTGIGGLDLSQVEGEIAGYAAAGELAKARRCFSRRKVHRRFAEALERAFALRPELKDLPSPDTLVCRCEDVPLAKIRDHAGWREAKLQTRCGMGACQGRVCGGAVDFLLGWKSESVRPPIFPTRLGRL